MTLKQLLKYAAAFGIDLDLVKKIALEQGVPAAREFVVSHVRKQMSAAIPKAFKNLEKKAPLDGQRRTDKDGVEMSDIEFFLHELDFLLWKAALGIGHAANIMRDTHIGKMWLAVNGQVGETREALAGRLVAEEIRLTF